MLSTACVLEDSIRERCERERERARIRERERVRVRVVANSVFHSLQGVCPLPLITQIPIEMNRFTNSNNKIIGDSEHWVSKGPALGSSSTLH